MRRGVVTALLISALFVPALGQMRGGAARGIAAHGVAGGFGGHGFVGRGFSGHGFGRGSVIVGSFHSGVRFRTGFPGHFHRRFFPYAYGYYPYAYYGGFDYPYYSTDSYTSDDPYQRAAAYYDSTQQLSSEINRLSNEVERLREQQQSTPPPAARASNSQTDDKPTVLAFRDGHKEEVKNYAIVGKTLWILNDQRARKLDLADLDVPATRKLNDERGIDFQLPE